MTKYQPKIEFDPLLGKQQQERTWQENLAPEQPRNRLLTDDSALGSLGAKLDQLTREIRTLNEKLGKAEARQVSLEQANKELRASLDRQQKNADGMRKQLADLGKIGKDLRSDLGKQVDGMEQRLNRTVAMVFSPLPERIDAIASHIDRLDQNHDDRLQGMEERFQSLSNQVSGLEASLAGLSETVYEDRRDRHYRYLIEAKTRIESLLAASETNPAMATHLLKGAAQTACFALQQLVRDRHFSQAVTDLALTGDRHRKSMRELVKDLDQFAQFLETERQLFTAAGLSSAIADDLISYIQGLAQTDIAKLRHGINPETLLASVRSVQSQTCDLARDYPEAPDRSRVKGKLKAAAAALGGASILVLNYSPIATQLGMVDAGSALSGTCGGVIIEKSVEAFLGR